MLPRGFLAPPHWWVRSKQRAIMIDGKSSGQHLTGRVAGFMLANASSVCNRANRKARLCREGPGGWIVQSEANHYDTVRQRLHGLYPQDIRRLRRASTSRCGGEARRGSERLGVSLGIELSNGRCGDGDLLKKVVSREGIEPSTRRLRVCCSAN